MIKTCSWGTCDSNSEYDENGSDPRPSMFGVKFYGFPKPFLRSPKCKAWVKACGRKDFSVKQVTINSFICSKHFRGGKPSKLHPMPEPATAETTASGDLSEKGSTSDLVRMQNEVVVVSAFRAAFIFEKSIFEKLSDERLRTTFGPITQSKLAPSPSL